MWIFVGKWMEGSQIYRTDSILKAYLSHIVVSFLQTESCESQGRLTSTTVLFGQVDCEFGDHLS